MSILIGPVGNISRGGVLDVNEKYLLRKLRDYDSQLYISWNPKKRGKHGVWEIHRRPDYKAIFLVGELDGHNIYSYDYNYNPLDTHILDAGSLNYDILTKIKSIDRWATTGSEKGGNRVYKWLDDYEHQEAEYKRLEQQKIYDDMLYNLKQEKSMLKDYKEVILRGEDPNNLAKFWK